MGSYSPIGIDIGTADIKLVQLVREKGTWVPFALGLQLWSARSTDDVQFDDCFTAALRAAFEGGGFKGKRAIVSAPACLVDIWPVKVPLSEGVDVASFVQSEIAERRGQLTSDFVVDYWIGGDTVEHGESKIEAYAVSASHEKVVSMVRAVEKAGICCTRVEVAATSLAHCVELADEEPLLLLDIGDRSSMLMAMDSVGITFCREIKWGGHHVTSRLKTALDIDMETAAQIKEEWGIRPISDASGADSSSAHPRQQVINDSIEQEIRVLALEIGRSLAYRARSSGGGDSKELALVGGGARLRGLDRFLKDALKLTVKSAPIIFREGLSRKTEDDGLNGGAEQFAIATGTAMTGVN